MRLDFEINDALIKRDSKRTWLTILEKKMILVREVINFMRRRVARPWFRRKLLSHHRFARLWRRLRLSHRHVSRL